MKISLNDEPFIVYVNEILGRVKCLKKISHLKFNIIISLYKDIFQIIKKLILKLFIFSDFVNLPLNKLYPETKTKLSDESRKFLGNFYFIYCMNKVLKFISLYNVCTMYIKAKLKKSNRQTNINKYTFKIKNTEYHIRKDMKQNI